MGLNCWSDDPAQIENAMLASKLAKKQSQKVVKCTLMKSITKPQKHIREYLNTP